MPPAPEVVDFHVHYADPAWSPNLGPQSAQIERLSAINDLDVLLASSPGVATLVVNAPPALLGHDREPLSPADFRDVNTRLADRVAERDGRVAGLATIDPWQGDNAAAEVARAVDELELSGIVIDAASAGGDELLDATRSHDALRAAAERRVPVFVHPVFPRGFSEQLTAAGRPGVLLSRGAITAGSLLALLQSDAADDLASLEIVTPLIALPVLYAARFDGVDTSTLHFDTMGFDPGTIRYLVDEVGPGRVVVGSDSPIVASGLTPEHALDALTKAGLTPDAIDLVAGRNAKRLLDRGGPRAEVPRAHDPQLGSSPR